MTRYRGLIISLCLKIYLHLKHHFVVYSQMVLNWPLCKFSLDGLSEYNIMRYYPINVTLFHWEQLSRNLLLNVSVSASFLELAECGSSVLNGWFNLWSALYFWVHWYDLLNQTFELVALWLIIDNCPFTSNVVECKNFACGCKMLLLS